ncbi:hypothetical protein ACP70R_001448 [Stipagrostis hirtigluma subsp. patula]
MGQPIPGLKTQWPMLQGKSWEEAFRQIKSDRSDVHVEKFCVGETVHDTDNERVIVWISPSTSKVFSVPRVG